MKYYHVDVFASQPLSGNGLTVVFPDKEIDIDTLQKITQEFRQFETIFIFSEQNGYYPVRIFTVEEELEFAGHPILGAAAVIHSLQNDNPENLNVKLKAGSRIISVDSEITDSSYTVTMNQGIASFIRTLNKDNSRIIAAAMYLSADDLHQDYPVEVVSTGLPYLLLPVNGALEKVRISIPDFEQLIKTYDAKFTYVFNPETLECRTWDNSGLVEDIATGSAAGPLCAYLVKNNFKSYDEIISISQGRFINRKSNITGYVKEITKEVFIKGEVVFFSHGDIII
ncbi:MAG: PhzF family phenazine biosynthesis protein [Spirochaetes bacterium]|nr:PhzF family phenazine biosynthesis protein [Spirochaetota bacterium]